jgi:hypothetical protein
VFRVVRLPWICVGLVSVPPIIMRWFQSVRVVCGTQPRARCALNATFNLSHVKLVRMSHSHSTAYDGLGNDGRFKKCFRVSWISSSIRTAQLLAAATSMMHHGVGE